MSVKPWNTLAKNEIAKTPIFRLNQVRRESPQGKQADFFVVDLPSWVNVFAFTPDDQIVLIKQYRHGTDDITLEVPGGGIDADESPLEAAIRELREETGFTCESWALAGHVDVNPAIQSNQCWTLVGRGAKQTHPTAPDEHEEIDVVMAPSTSMEELIRSRQITHSLVVAGWYLVNSGFVEET